VAVETDILPARYQSPRQIGRGGMGEIYLATDSALGRPVAVKMLAERYADDDAVRGRFTREALAAARLSSEAHIVTIFDVGEWNGRPFLVMEYLPGGSLEDVVRRGPQPPGEVLEWLEQAAVALDAAHDAGVVHRDVKPANLLVDAGGQVHVADFGIASAAGLDSLTRPGTILGTAGYLPPEQAKGERAGPATDQYAIAVVAFELLTGRRPYESENPTVEAAAHVHAAVPRATSVNPQLPPQLDAVFQRALAKEPGERFSSCAELVQALRRAFDDAAGQTREHAVVVDRPGPAPVLTPSAPEPRRRSLLVPLALLGLVAAGAAGVALASFLGGAEDSDTAPPAPKTVVTTIVETRPGTTVREVVTRRQVVTQEVPAPPPPPEPPPPPPAPSTASGAELNDQGFRRMQAGDYSGALPLLEQAVAKLSGTGGLAEAYALYNLAYTRLQLGSCDGVEDMLARSQQIQGRRTEIDQARARTEQQC
jgi:eukaryotic-like serine/threonine-protein kinase